MASNNNNNNNAALPSTNSSPSQYNSSPALDPTTKPFTLSQPPLLQTTEQQQLAPPHKRPASAMATTPLQTPGKTPPKHKASTTLTAKAPHFVPRNNSNPSTPLQASFFPHNSHHHNNHYRIGHHGHASAAGTPAKQHRKRQKRASTAPATPQNGRVSDGEDEWTDDDEFIPTLAKGRE